MSRVPILKTQQLRVEVDVGNLQSADLAQTGSGLSGELASTTDQPPSTLAAQLVCRGIDTAVDHGKVRPRRQPTTPARHKNSDGNPAWLERYGGDRAWRADMWGAIVALHGRYPEALDALKDGWWNHHTHVETLCALAVWRERLDDGGEDPREELAFQIQLSAYSQVLRQAGGGVTKTWKPGAPPTDWT